jgi:putative membrane protein
MYVKRNYSLWLTFKWSMKPFIYGFLYSLLVFCLYSVCKYYFTISIALPWNPIGIIGIGVAFYLGFKNNASYDRVWEARKIWGGIVNNSRSFGAAVNAFIHGKDQETIKRKIIYRHIAWLTALRFQLRLAREWEHLAERIPGVYFPDTSDKYFHNLSAELEKYLSKEEIDSCIHKANIATQLLAIQAVELQKLKDENYFENFRHMEFHKLISTFYDDQGRSERIKNFPFPRQYASAALWLSFIFAALIPFGLLDVLGSLEITKQWIVIPLSALIIWIFFLMEKIGDYSENPFEGSYNDVPISAIARSIEIDLRQIINDTNVPEPVKSDNGFLM